jgi:hypothetical protein
MDTLGSVANGSLFASSTQARGEPFYDCVYGPMPASRGVSGQAQIEGVPFDFPDDVLLNNLPLEAAERILNRLAILESHLSQTAPPSRPDSSGAVMEPLPGSEPSRREPTSLSILCRA